jgi:hypothetical protein
MIEELAKAAAELVAAHELRQAVGGALTEEQQITISRMVTVDPKRFHRWLATDEGRVATRNYVDMFLGRMQPGTLREGPAAKLNAEKADMLADMPPI